MPTLKVRALQNNDLQPVGTRYCGSWASEVPLSENCQASHVTEYFSRWAKRVMPAVLRDLMRHSSVSTTMAYYVNQTAEDVGDVLRAALGNNSGNSAADAIVSVDIDADEKHVTIRT